MDTSQIKRILNPSKPRKIKVENLFVKKPRTKVKKVKKKY